MSDERLRVAENILSEFRGRIHNLEQIAENLIAALDGKGLQYTGDRLVARSYEIYRKAAKERN